MFLELSFDKNVEGTRCSLVRASLTCGLTIAIFCITSVFMTAGISAFFDIYLSGFSAMSYVLAVGFSVEYTVHLVHRFIACGETGPMKRAECAVEQLFKPVTYAMLASFLGVIVMGTSDILFVRTYFFAPLVIVMLVTFHLGMFVLPALLSSCFGGFIVMGLDTSNVQTVPKEPDDMDDAMM